MVLLRARDVSLCARPYLCSVSSNTHMSLFTVLKNEKDQCFLFQQGLAFFSGSLFIYTFLKLPTFSVQPLSQPANKSYYFVVYPVFFLVSCFIFNPNQKWLTNFLCLVFSYGFLISLIILSSCMYVSVICICVHDIVCMQR